MRISWNALIGTGCVVFGAAMLADAPPDFAEAPELARVMIREGRDFAMLAMLLGVGILLAPFLDARLGVPRFRTPGLRTLAPLVIVPLALALFLCQDRIRATKTDIVPWPGGERFFWLDDDMMVSMRYAMNFGRGEGLRWNAGEPAVEGYTNFLWTLVLSIPHALGAPSRLAAAFPLALDSAIFAGVVVLFMALAVRARVAPSLALAGGLALASNRWLVHWTVAGSEVAPMALALIAIHALATGRGRLGSSRRRPIALGVLLAAVSLLRADGLVLVAAHAPALALLIRRERRREGVAQASSPVSSNRRSPVWPMLAIPAVAALGHFLFRRAYYGEWLPNTYALKAVGIHMQAPMGFNYAQYLPILMGGACALHLLHAATARRPVERALAVVPWAVALYAAWIGGDELPEMRFVAPVVPLLLLGAVRALNDACMRGASGIVGQASCLSRVAAVARNDPDRQDARPTAVALAILALATFKTLLLPYALRDLGAARYEQERRNLEIGLMLRHNTAPDARVAHFWAGAAPYFSERPAIDLLGKCDARIAALPGKPYQWPPGHVKYDMSISLARGPELGPDHGPELGPEDLGPDVIVSALPLSKLDPATRARDPEAVSYPALHALYDAPEFARYATGPVRLPASEDYHGVFVREGSPRARAASEWEAPLPPASPPKERDD